MPVRTSIVRRDRRPWPRAPDYDRPVRTEWDAIVVGLGGIGSGAAFWLSERLGDRVLGLEQFELGHRNGLCTFETLLELYELTEPALQRMATVIRAADLPTEEGRPPEAAGVAAIFDGLRYMALTDEERLERGFAVCDGLLAYFS